MKLLICLMLVCLTLASTNLRNNPTPTILESSTSDLQDLQTLFNGFAQNVGTAFPNIGACVDDASAQTLMDFFSNTFDNLAACDFVAISKDAEGLQTSLSGDVNACLNNDQAVNDALVAYGVKDVDHGVIVAKFATYALTGNADALANQASQVEDAFKREDYQGAGNLFGKLLQTVMGYNPEAAPETITVLAVADNEEESSDYDNSEDDLTPTSFSLKSAAKDLFNDSSDNDNSDNDKAKPVALYDNYGYNGDYSDYSHSDYDGGKTRLLAVVSNEEESSDYDGSEDDLTPTSFSLKSAANKLLNDSSDDDNSDNDAQLLVVVRNEEESSDDDATDYYNPPVAPKSVALYDSGYNGNNYGDSSNGNYNNGGKVQLLAIADNEEESSDYDNSEDDVTPTSFSLKSAAKELLNDSSDDDNSDNDKSVSLSLKSAAKKLLNDSSDDDNSDNDKTRPATIALYEYDGNYNNNYGNHYDNNYNNDYDHGRKL